MPVAPAASLCLGFLGILMARGPCHNSTSAILSRASNSLHRGLPFVGVVFCLGELGDVVYTKMTSQFSAFKIAAIEPNIRLHAKSTPFGYSATLLVSNSNTYKIAIAE